ncbi:hypothetical protein [Streptomyces sp. NPDC056948]|uniref:hypothetical protein n=1 Tax=Streptomyces sp. NPDC056948 TaxID=3345975 RepID=UPI00362A98D4
MTTDPRTAILSDLCHPEWNPVSESHGLSHDDAVNLVNAHEADVLKRAASTQPPLPAGFERKSCVTVACAACGYPYDEAEFTMHFPSAREAADHVVGDGWDELKDGRVLCIRTDEQHDELRRTVGVIDPDDDTA